MEVYRFQFVFIGPVFNPGRNVLYIVSWSHTTWDMINRVLWTFISMSMAGTCFQLSWFLACCWVTVSKLRIEFLAFVAVGVEWMLMFWNIKILKLESWFDAVGQLLVFVRVLFVESQRFRATPSVVTLFCKRYIFERLQPRSMTSARN